jgi:tricorn protease-like protein
MSDGKSILFGDSIYYLSGGKISINDAFPLNREVFIGFSNKGNELFTGKILADSLLITRHKNTGENTLFKIFCTWTSSVKVSQDGRWLTYTKTKGGQTDTSSLMVYDLQSGKENCLAIACRYSPGYEFSHYSISLDSKSVFMGYGGKIHKIDIETGSDYIIPFTAKVNIDLGPLDYNTFKVTHDSLHVNYTRSANASSDGKLLVFSALNKAYIMDIPNGKPHILTNQTKGQFFPIFSPDDKWVAYTSWSDREGGQVWRVSS